MGKLGERLGVGWTVGREGERGRDGESGERGD